MGGAKEGTETMMEVDSIVAKVATKSTQVAHDTIEAAIKIVHPSALFTIIEIGKVLKTFNWRMALELLLW